MSKSYLVSMFLLCSTICLAQNEGQTEIIAVAVDYQTDSITVDVQECASMPCCSSKRSRSEFGFNVSPLLQKIISPQSTFNQNGELLFFYNYRLTDNTYWRAGGNFSLLGRTNPDDNDEENNSSNNFSTLDVRTGVEWRKSLSNRFEFHYGAQLLYQGQNFSFSSGDFESSMESKSYGLGPVAGLTFWISDRIGIWAESSLNLMRTNDKTISTFTDFTGERIEQVSNTNANSISTRIPTSLFIKIRI
jgi:hypothetical protein